LREFLKKKGIWIAIVAVLVAIVGAVSTYVSAGNSGLFSKVGNTLLKPVKSVVSSLAGTMENIYGYMYEYDKLAARNAELEARIAKYEDEYKEYIELAEENERLYALFEFSKSHTDHKYEQVNIIAWGASNYSSTFTISKGTTSGIELYDTVVNENGYLVGLVTEVNDVSATVTTILDTTSNIGASLYTTNEIVVAKGDVSLMPENRLKLAYLPENANLASGDVVTTVGGGYYLQGLIIGYIEDVRISSSGLDDYAVIEPGVDFDSLSHVFVITEHK